MSLYNAPFGLKPLYHPSGILRPKAADVASGYNTNLFMGTPITFVPGTASLQAAGQTGPAIGSFLGVEFTPASGRRQFSPYWPAGQVATQIVAYYTDDPWMTYEIQADAAVQESSVGAQANLNAEAGNTTTGFSTISLETSTLTNTGNGLVRIVGISQGPWNQWGDAYTIVQVQISNHLFVANRAA